MTERAYPNHQAWGLHRVMPDNDHDAPTDAGICRCSKAPLRTSLRELTNEMVRARIKFPQSRYLTAALGEEIGELAEAYEKSGTVPPPQFTSLIKHFGELQRATLQRRDRNEIKLEALQAACVAMRIYEEGDPLYDSVDDEAAKP